MTGSWDHCSRNSMLARFTRTRCAEALHLKRFSQKPSLAEAATAPGTAARRLHSLGERLQSAKVGRVTPRPEVRRLQGMLRHLGREGERSGQAATAPGKATRRLPHLGERLWSAKAGRPRSAVDPRLCPVSPRPGVCRLQAWGKRRGEERSGEVRTGPTRQQQAENGKSKSHGGISSGLSTCQCLWGRTQQ